MASGAEGGVTGSIGASTGSLGTKGLVSGVVVVVVVAGTSTGTVTPVAAVASTEPGWFDSSVVVVVVEACEPLAWRPCPLCARWSLVVVVPPEPDEPEPEPDDPATVVVVDPPEAITGDPADGIGEVVGTAPSDDAESLLADRSDAGDAEVEEGMAAGRPTAITATAATVPPNMTLERPSGSGAEPMSHRLHCFMACSQLFIPEPLRICIRHRRRPADTATARDAR